MITKLSATEVSRNFSAVLNRVAAGEEIEITRNGSTVAVLKRPRRYFISAAEFQRILDEAPPVDDQFAEDIRRIRAEIGPPEDPWQS